jgi:hypothetical protein
MEEHDDDWQEWLKGCKENGVDNYFFYSKFLLSKKLVSSL